MSSSRKAAGRFAGTLGMLAVAAIPVAVLVSEYLKGVPLVRALYVAVPVSAVLALWAVAAARRARFARARSVRPAGSRWPTRLAWAGMYAAVTGALALAVYAVLRTAQ